MSLEDKKDAYMKRMLGSILIFAILGCIVLLLATSYLSKVFSDVLPAG
ncbi:MAG: hypothetical protein K2X93_11615 [Candidatus Obscuribacterales bacterium]|nr:hypothetical protein [Candidatus Obscuribacterales bacterium]